MVLRALRHGTAEALFRLLPHGRAERMGQGTAGLGEPAPSVSQGIRAAQGGRVAACRNAMDQAFPGCGDGQSRLAWTRTRRGGYVRRAERGGNLDVATA